MKKIFPPNTIKTLYRREKNLKEILSSSLFPSKAKQIENSITSCDKCDICKNFLGSDTKFKCKVTGRVYNIRGKLTCDTSNVVYLISCSNPRKVLKVQITESVHCGYSLEGKLWERERYWQCQIFTNTHGMNSVSDLHSTKRKGCRKK